MGIGSLLGWGLAQGVAAPDFSLKGADNKLYTLSQYRGKRVFLYFYPRAFTGGCTAQACSFRSDYTLILQQGYILLGVSTDAISVAQAFKEKYSLPFPLLSDSDKKIARKYEVLLPFGMANRVTFLIDGQGVIEKVFRFLPWQSYAKSLLAGAGVSA